VPTSVFESRYYNEVLVIRLFLGETKSGLNSQSVLLVGLKHIEIGLVGPRCLAEPYCS